MTTITDIKEYKVINSVSYMFIAVGVLVTGNWLTVIVAFTLMALLIRYKRLRWCGGDVKVFMAIAAFIGWWFLPTLMVTQALVSAYRFTRNYRMGLPVTPFASVATLLMMLPAAILKGIVS